MLQNGKLKQGFQHPFSDEEIELIEQAQTPVTADMNQQRVLSEIYAAKIVEKSAHVIRESNRKMVQDIVRAMERVNESSDRNARAMTYLTAALVFVGVIQVVVQIVDFLQSSTL